MRIQGERHWWLGAPFSTPYSRNCHQLYPGYTLCRHWRAAARAPALSSHPLAKCTCCPEPSLHSRQSFLLLLFSYFLLCLNCAMHSCCSIRRNSWSFWLVEDGHCWSVTDRAQATFCFSAWLQILVLHTPEADGRMEGFTWTLLQHCNLICDGCLQIAAILHPCCCYLYGSADHCSQSKFPSWASQIWIFSKKQTFENTIPPAISNCCKVQTHPSSSCNNGKWHKNIKNHT